VERARLYLPDVASPAKTRTAIDEICVRLDGLPLAIELAAARLNVLSPEQIAARLSDRFRLLTGGSRTALPRQQTLRAAMDWSYDLLTEPERALLRRLSVFAGGCSLEAVETVCGEGNGQRATGNEEGTGPPLVARCSLPVARDDVLDTLAHLVDKSLVNARRRDGGVRYGLLETVRQYADERLEEAGEADATRRRHWEWCLALAEESEPALLGPEQGAWLGRLEEEHDNLRAALAWSLAGGEGAPALRLAGALARFWERRGYLSEGRAWLARALATGDDAPAEARAKTLHGAGVLAALQGDYAAARALHERSLALYRELEDGRGIAEAQGNLGRVLLRQGEYAAARPLLEASLALQQELGNEPGVAGVLGTLGQLALREGDHAAARATFEARLALLREVGDTDGIADALEDLATVAGEQGDVARQTVLLEEALVLFREIGSTRGRALVLGNLGMAAWARGEHERALSLLEESLARYREVGDRRGIARALGNQAFVALQRREYARASARCRESLALYREVGDAWAVGRYLPVLAGTAFAQGQAARAARLFGTAAGLREHLGSPLPPVVRTTHDRTVAAVRAALGDPAFEREWARGQVMSREADLALALSDAEPG
jgi:non-specific serine/threonine protein kinase